MPAITGDSATPATLSPRIITGLLRDSLGFRGTAITDAMTMEGVGKGYTTEQSSVLAVKAGADILLKPSDPVRAIDAIVASVKRGEISRARIDRAARHVLELKARSGAAFAPIVSLERLRAVVGSPAHRALARDVARRAVTVIRASETAMPIADTDRVLVVQYAPETEIRAGRTFAAELSSGRRGAVQVVKLGPTATQDQLAAVAQQAERAGRVVVAAFVRRVEGEGRFAIPQAIGDWIDTLAKGREVSVVAFGNPYLLRQFPDVQAYIVAYGVSDDLERAAAAVLRGGRATGRAPVSLPGFFAASARVQR